jgi:hypothetical protein
MKFGLDHYGIEERSLWKHNLFSYWDCGGTKPKPTLSEIIETVETHRYEQSRNRAENELTAR